MTHGTLSCSSEHFCARAHVFYMYPVCALTVYPSFSSAIVPSHGLDPESRSLSDTLKRQLEPVWNTVGWKTRQIVKVCKSVCACVCVCVCAACCVQEQAALKAQVPRRNTMCVHDFLVCVCVYVCVCVCVCVCICRRTCVLYGMFRNISFTVTL